MSYSYVAAYRAALDSGSSTPAVGSVTLAVGDLVFAVISWVGAQTISSISSPGSETWTQCSARQATSDGYMQAFWARVATGGTGSVTWNMSGSVTYSSMQVLRYTTTDAVASPIDTTAHTTGSGSTITSATYATSVANTLVILATRSVPTHTAGGSLTERTDGDYGFAGDRAQAAAASGLSESCTQSGSGNWTAHVIVAKTENAVAGPSANIVTQVMLRACS